MADDAHAGSPLRSPDVPRPPKPARTSRQRYEAFVEHYRKGSLDAATDALAGVGRATPAPGAGARRDHLRDYLRWLWPHRWSIAGLFVLALFGAGFEMIEPLFLRFIVDRVLLVDGLERSTRVLWLNLAGGTFLTVITLRSGVNIFRDYRQRLVNTRVMLSLRRSLYARLVRLPLAKLHEMKTGGILSRLTGDIDTTTGLLQMAIVSPSLSAVRLLIAMIVLFALNWKLALVALAIVPGAVLMSFVSAKRIRPIYRAVRKDVERVDGRVGETFSGIRVVRAFRRELLETLEYLRGRHTIVRKELFAHRRELWLWTSWGFAMSAVSVAIVWYGGHLYLQGSASVGDIMAFQWYSFLLLGPVWQIVNSFSELQRSLAATERVFEVLAMPNDKPDRPDAVDAPREVRELEFVDVEFEYREGRPVVRDFSVRVRGGSVVALVGRSGAGKTTITDLVARFHDPTRGKILLNGTDIRGFRLFSYRSLLAIVQQDVFLFDGSVRDNIAYGRHDATDAEIRDAARRANAEEFIVHLPEQYDTFIGERGVKLSGGQQQRLAIARAILAAPQILILDEATSNLDTESEQLIQASMATLLAGRTTFVIAHRLSTIRRADLILLLDQGRVVERGTHDELMARRGLYHDMVVRQMTSATDGNPELLR
ncbi:MAG TPA: ABC transporter ATP-binding protein [Gammaproteobacteria bacterium]|nr:ABC transporter ATP-binding protein [Gammaproteobacteria bacterium]